MHIGFGIMGGANQPLAHAQFVSNFVDYGMNIQAALSEPRFTVRPTEQGIGCDILIESRVPAADAERTGAKGPQVQSEERVFDRDGPRAGSAAQFEKQRELCGLRPAGRRLSRTGAGAGTLAVRSREGSSGNCRTQSIRILRIRFSKLRRCIFLASDEQRRSLDLSSPRKLAARSGARDGTGMVRYRKIMNNSKKELLCAPPIGSASRIKMDSFIVRG